MAFYTSNGAASEVTGSCHLLEIKHLKILIDCGLFQGREEKLNYEEFAFEPKEIDYLIVTHAHLDHIGRIPLLVKKGFNKKIISTKATYELAKLMLINAATILQEKENPLYTIDDAQHALSFFKIFLEPNELLELEEEISISFKNAGHILGSVSLKVDYFEDSMKKSTVFSGDIGQKHRLITSPIEFWDDSNYIFLESTYGDRIHEDLDISITKIKENISNVISKGGVVVLPSFALERTQEILYILKQMSDEKKLANVPVFLDAPLAINITKLFLKYSNLLNEELQDMIHKGKNPFHFEELEVCYTKEESIKINNTPGAKIIIAGSGMCEGGRVKYHLLRYLQSSQNLIIFVGFQVDGTLGRKILDGQRIVEIENLDIKVNAQVRCIDGFSAHADQKDLIAFMKDFKSIFCIYLIHGDDQKLEIFKNKVCEKLEKKVHVVKMKERIYI